MFVKAVGPDINPDSAGIHRREIASSRGHARGRPRPPPPLVPRRGRGRLGGARLRGHRGRASPPALGSARARPRPRSARRASASRLTPSPLPEGVAPRGLRRVSPGRLAILRDGPPPPAQSLAPWFRSNLDRLADLEAQAPEAVAGDTLVHFDIRADNLLLDARSCLVPRLAPRLRRRRLGRRAIVTAPSVTMQGGPPPEESRRRPPRLPHRRPRPRDGGRGGDWPASSRSGARDRPPPGLPNLRAFQEAQASVARDWLLRRLG